MSDQSSGGVANWAGAAFELRLGVEFCIHMLVGDVAGLAPGAVSLVQPQAPETVDDLMVRFESGARWAIQAKAGWVGVSWDTSSPFGQALRQLCRGAAAGQIDLCPGSLDRVELAVDERAAHIVGAFGHWLDKAREHVTWEGLATACTSTTEKGYLAASFYSELAALETSREGHGPLPAAGHHRPCGRGHPPPPPPGPPSGYRHVARHSQYLLSSHGRHGSSG